MAPPNQPRMQASNTVQIDSHAAATLRYIRSSMDAATALAVPGSAGIAMGVIGILAMLLCWVPGLAAYWLSIWLCAAIVAAIIGGVLVLRPASLHTLALSGAPVRKFALCLLPSLFAGAVLTVVLSLHDVQVVIPGTWLVLYGCALIPASVSTRQSVGVMGASFAALGLLALAMPLHVQMLLLGAGFGGLHLGFGVWLSRRTHGREA